MSLKHDNLHRLLADGQYGLSVRRLWEHTQYRQINPFRPIKADSITLPQAFIDVVKVTKPFPIYLGATLQDFCTDPLQWVHAELADDLLLQIKTKEIDQWLQEVSEHLSDTCKRLAVRNVPAQFLESGNDYPLAIPGIRCALEQWLVEKGKEKANSEQWLCRIRNLTGKGLKKEEFDVSGVEELLATIMADNSVTGDWIHKQLDYRDLRISIIPVTKASPVHLNWIPAPSIDDIKRVKPKIKNKLASVPQWRDPVLGYWVDRVDWNDLLGVAQGWMAFDHRGMPLVSEGMPTGLYGAPDHAMRAANQNAEKLMPRLTSKGRWTCHRLSGGENYREWLVTLPHYRPTYFSDHFDYRNVLLHVRSDVRESVGGEKVLFIQEIQSDWAQQARRQLKQVVEPRRVIPLPPWLQEWPALALKLMLLHAAEHQFDALAWTTGEEQSDRYEGKGRHGLLELYDRTLTKEADRILKPIGAVCGVIEIFIPVNYFIDPTDNGYEVLDGNYEHLGIASTFLQAQSLIPDGAEERLATMHGIKLNAELRRVILEKGFYAWGSKVK